MSAGFLFIKPIFAQQSLLSDALIQEAQCNAGQCSLNTFIKVGINLANIILGLVGALTLIMFVYGGVTWLLSGGSAEKVSKGKEIIVGSVVGLLIVFGSFTIIKFVINDVLQPSGDYEFTGDLPDDPEIKKVEENECSKIGGTCKNPCALEDITINDNGYCGKTNQYCCKVEPKECANNGQEGCATACANVSCLISEKECSGTVRQVCCRKGAGCSY